MGTISMTQIFVYINVFMAKRYMNLFHVTLKVDEKLGSLSQNLDCSPHLSLPTSLL